MLIAGAFQVTVATNSWSLSVSVKGGATPPTPSGPWQPAQLYPPSAVGANSRSPRLMKVCVELVDGAVLPARLVEPVERQADGGDGEEEQARW